MDVGGDIYKNCSKLPVSSLLAKLQWKMDMNSICHIVRNVSGTHLIAVFEMVIGRRLQGNRGPAQLDFISNCRYATTDCFRSADLMVRGAICDAFSVVD